MFEHSVRVPRHYKVAANIFKKVSTEGGSVKTLLYDNKLRHFRTNVLFALITETVKHAAHIDKIFETSEILKKESRLDPWLAKILTAELLFGKKALPGISKPEQTILSYREQFEKYTNEHEDELKTEVIHRPRYVRINTNLLTTSDAIRFFQDEGYRFIRCTSGSYDDYLKQIKSLVEYDFTQDYHVKTIFVFPHGTKLHEHELYLKNQIILQDKATALAVHLLAPSSGSVIMDMCAAPGMKTTQLAACIRNEGKIYAVERNEQRFQTLTDFVDKTGCKCVQLIHKDSLEIRRGEYDDVEYILLDPSCSGSGMEFSVHNYIEETRLAKLTSLQEKFLKHAMNAFPKAKRIVYSTCSLFPEENERVITNVVKNSRTKWRVQDVKEMLKGQWNNFGSGMYGSMGTRCLYARPDLDLTTGFFLAVLDRDSADLQKAINVDDKVVNEETRSHKNTTEGSLTNVKRKKKSPCIEINVKSEVESENRTKKKKKSKNIKENNDEEDANIVNENGEHVDAKRKKKKQGHAINPNESDVKLKAPMDIVRKKKNRVVDEKESSRNDVIDIQIDNERSTLPESEAITMKRKKKKREVIKDIDSPVLKREDEEDEPKKKKHKNRVDTNNDDLEVCTKNQIADDLDVQHNHDELVTKKKKKKRDKKCK